jgi:pyridoxamine 5'-phosphate oxidase
MPSTRMVLLKDWTEEGFVFYTNFKSRKGIHIKGNNKASMLFHWKSLDKQVRIEGNVKEVLPEEADAYFSTRPRTSQIGAWASKQSRALESIYSLERAVAKYAIKFPIGDVPRPPHWSGFRISPELMEFWEQGNYRLHKRQQFIKSENGVWQKEMLYP